MIYVVLGVLALIALFAWLGSRSKPAPKARKAVARQKKRRQKTGARASARKPAEKPAAKPPEPDNIRVPTRPTPRAAPRDVKGDVLETVMRNAIGPLGGGSRTSSHDKIIDAKYREVLEYMIASKTEGREASRLSQPEDGRGEDGTQEAERPEAQERKRQDVENEIIHLEEMRDGLRSVNTGLKENIEALAKREMELIEKIKAMESERETAQAARGEERARVDERIEEQQRRHDRYAEEISKLEETREELRAAATRLEENVNTLAERETRLMEKIASLESELASARSRDDGAAEDPGAKGEFGEEAARLERTRDELRAANQGLEENVTALRSQETELKQKTAALEAELETAREEKMDELDRLVAARKEAALNEVMAWSEEEKARLAKQFDAQYREQAAGLRQNVIGRIHEEFDQIHKYFTEFAENRTSAMDAEIKAFIEDRRAAIQDTLDQAENRPES